MQLSNLCVHHKLIVVCWPSKEYEAIVYMPRDATLRTVLQAGIIRYANAVYMLTCCMQVWPVLCLLEVSLA